MIPEAEYASFHRDLADAANLAVVGEVTDGLKLLRAGLGRAEAVSLSEDWGEELMLLYRDALRRYASDYPVAGSEPDYRLPSPGPERGAEHTLRA